MILGVDIVINYYIEDFVIEIKWVIVGKGVDVIVDLIVGDYVVCNYEVVVMNGWIV